MGQISLRLSDEQEKRLRSSAEANNIQFTVYLRQLLALGEQVEDALPKRQSQAVINKSYGLRSVTMSRTIMAATENLYLMRYLVGKLFKEEGEIAKKIARAQAEKSL